MKVRLLGCIFFFYWSSVYRELVSLWHAPATVRRLSSIEGRGHRFLCFLCLFSLLDSVPSQVLPTVSFPPLLKQDAAFALFQCLGFVRKLENGSLREEAICVFSANQSAGS